MGKSNRTKTVFFSFVVITFLWLLLSFLFGIYEAASDGLNEVGFPFTFYRKFSGKGIDCEYNTGFFFWGFIFNVLIILFLSLLIGFFPKKNRLK